MPCPMPQIRGLQPAQAFIAVSAERNTNLAHLWAMVHPLLTTGEWRAGRAWERPMSPPIQRTISPRKARADKAD